MTAPQPTIGVLALQGDFDAHRRRLEELGAKVVLVKKPEQFDKIDGLIIPGGESSTLLKLLGEAGFEKLKQFVQAKPAFGTCAGAILLATKVENPPQASLGALDITVRRNAYGRQIDSSIREGNFENHPIEMVFIPKSNALAKTSKSSRPRAIKRIPSLCARAKPWPQPFIPNSARTQASTNIF